jgi:hypothetical protein
MLREFLQASPAWRSLTPQARVVYVELARIYNGANNGRLALSARVAAERCNIAKNTATRAFRELTAKGLIDCATPGGFSYKLRHAAEWRLTEHRCDRTGEVPSKRFLRWTPPDAKCGLKLSPTRSQSASNGSAAPSESDSD